MIRRLLLAVLIAALIGAFFIFDLQKYFSLDFLKTQQQLIDGYYQAHPARTLIIYFLVYVFASALALPAALWLTLAGGAIFGLWTGVVVVSFASSLGALLSFLVSRFLLRDWVQDRFGQKLKMINEGVKKEGGFYLLTMRLVPVFPFWVVNVAMGLTPIKALPYYLVSQLGMFPATVIYVNAGRELAKLTSSGDILSPTLFFSLSLLGIFPLVAKRSIDAIKARRVLRRYDRPRQFDRDIVVIGGGSAGLVSAYLAATLRAKVTLIEEQKMGGDCLNTGCVPSKTLLRTARLIHEIRHAERFGLDQATEKHTLANVMQKVRESITAIEPHDSVERYTKLGVDVRLGKGYILSPYEVRIKDETLTTRNIVVATGASPCVPKIEGLAPEHFSTSDTVWNLQQFPRKLVVMGGGPVGCELAQAFARLGSEVTIVEMLPRLLHHEDPDISERVYSSFVQEGIHVRLGQRAVAVKTDSGETRLHCASSEGDTEFLFDHLLIATGRIPHTREYGLNELGIRLTESGSIEVNDFLQTNYPNIFACGDVAGPYHFTHTASHQAWYATVNALFGSVKKFRVDYSVIPRATFTDPEVARVGLNELEAKGNGINYEVTTFDLNDLDRAIVDSTNTGVVKVLTVPGKDRILGATIVGSHASEWIVEFVSAMRHRSGLNKILQTVHIYPTFAEANKYAAGVWKRRHAPDFALRLLERYHGWRRR